MNNKVLLNHCLTVWASVTALFCVMVKTDAGKGLMGFWKDAATLSVYFHDNIKLTDVNRNNKETFYSSFLVKYLQKSKSVTKTAENSQNYENKKPI